MYAPALLPDAESPSAAVLAVERALLANEGPHHVEGRYYASAFDADRQRRQTAERTVREAERRADYQARERAVSALRVPTPRVVTWLTARERMRLDAAATVCAACLVAIHRDTLRDVRRDLAGGDVDALLVSVGRITRADASALATLVRGFPGVPVFGFVDEMDDARAVSGALLLGQAGASGLYDVRTPGGWRAFRDAFAPGRLPDAFLRACVASVLADVRGAADAVQVSGGLARFFCLAFAPDVTSAKSVAARLGIIPTTLACRFFRAGLPSPRRYVTLARLTWAAWLGEQPGRSLTDIAHCVDASSPQSFQRTVRLVTGRSAADFRRTMTGRAMLDQYRSVLVAPYRDTLRTFDPLNTARRGEQRVRRCDPDVEQGRAVA